MKKMNKSHGRHVYLDCVGYQKNNIYNGEWILQTMIEAANLAKIRVVHSHVEEFDGSVSPPGFAACTLLDESHITAHCYYDKGWLAFDAFTCGDSDPEIIADHIEKTLSKKMKNLKIKSRSVVKRFIYD